MSTVEPFRHSVMSTVEPFRDSVMSTVEPFRDSVMSTVEPFLRCTVSPFRAETITLSKTTDNRQPMKRVLIQTKRDLKSGTTSSRFRHFKACISM